MSMTTGVASSLPLPRPREAPQGAGAVAWVKANLFATWISTAVTLALGYIIVRIIIAFVGWAFVWAVWSVPYSPTGIAETAVCQNAKGFGACWAVIHDKYRLILFGRYTCIARRPLCEKCIIADLCKWPGKTVNAAAGA